MIKWRTCIAEALFADLKLINSLRSTAKQMMIENAFK